MPNKLIVSYEIAWDDDKTYSALRSALHSAIVDSVPRNSVWCETTSFYVIATKENSAGLLKRIVSEAKLRSTKDKLLVINMNGEGGAAWGNIADDDLYLLLPFVKKL